MNPSSAATGSSVVACTLGSEDLATQSARWKRLHAEAGIEHITIRDGLRLTFRDKPDVERELRELVAVENECCAWARWKVVRENRVLVMEARSSGAGIATLHAMVRVPAALLGDDAARA